jgi:hypothetical protein
MPCRQGTSTNFESTSYQSREYLSPPYWVSDACYFAGKPLATEALGVFDASLTTIRAHETNANSERNTTYRCLFPEPPPPAPCRLVPRPGMFWMMASGRPGIWAGRN